MRVPRPALSPRGRIGLAAALVCTAGVAAAPTAASAAGRVVLAPPDPEVTHVAAQGGVVAWLSDDVSDRGGRVRPRYLTVRDAGTTTARRVDLRLPKGTFNLDVGSDAAGRPVALLDTRTHTWTVPLAPGADPVARRLPGSKGWGLVAMYRGRVAYTRGSGGVTKVLVARRPGAPGRVAFRFPRAFGSADLALGRDDAVFAHGGRAVDNGVADIVWWARGGASRKLLSQSTGGASENGMGPLTVTNGGTRVNVSRWNVGGGHPNDLTRFSARTGRKLSTKKAAKDPTADAVEQLGLDRGESVINPVSTLNCSTPGDPVPDVPACLTLTLLTR
jgi:hypothetical protein